jgi:hypothetical protein
MQGETGERWRTLCEQAAVEQDPHKLMKLVQQISQILDEKLKRTQGNERTQANEQSAA